MTNLEFFKDDLLKIVATGKRIAIFKGKPAHCFDVLLCRDCDRCYNCTDSGLTKWLMSEHVEKSENSKICKNLKIDDKILVSNSGEYWEKRHFARYDSESDSILVFDTGTTSWTASEKCVSRWNYVKLPEEGDEQNV